jgi:hypothetical protein
MSGDPRAEQPTTTQPPRPTTDHRAIARAIVEEFRPMIRQEVANGMLDFNERLAKLERRVGALEEGDEPKADITGTHSLEEIAVKRGEWEERYRRKVQRDQMKAIAEAAIAKAEAQGFAGWLARYGWKALGAALFAAWNAFMLWLARHR